MSTLRFFAVSLLIFFSAGCAAQVTPPPASLPRLADVLGRIRGRRHLSSFRSVVLIEIRISDSGDSASPLFDFFGEESETFAGKAVLLWKAPDALRMEILSPFGSPVFVVVARGGEVQALSVLRGRYYAGRADRESMASWLGLPVSAALMLRILQGGVPVLSGDETAGARLGWDDEMGALRLDVPPEGGGGRRQVAFLDLERFEPLRVLLGEDGTALEVRYGPFRRWGAGRAPGWTVIADPKRGNRVRFQILDDGAGDRKGSNRPGKGGEGFGPDLPDDLFRLDIPPGVTVIPLDGGKSR